jgi:hypothetical protein
MKERPIIFSAPMVRAIPDGRKTQTRRVVKPQPFYNEAGFLAWITSGTMQNQGRSAEEMVAHHCPYGVPGDRLWVRETWRELGSGQLHDGSIPKYHVPCVYAADFDDNGDRQFNGPWRSPIYMPRWASRINLLLTDVRVERLQEISEEDAIAEGVDIGCPAHEADQPLPTMLYERLWDSINGKKHWESNPWVWVLTFAKTEENQ